MSDTKFIVNFKFLTILDNNGMTSDAAINTLTRFLFEKEQARKYKIFLNFRQCLKNPKRAENSQAKFREFFEVFSVRYLIFDLFICKNTSSKLTLWYRFSPCYIDVGDGYCWWQLGDVGDRLKVFVTDYFHCKSHQHH